MKKLVLLFLFMASAHCYGMHGQPKRLSMRDEPTSDHEEALLFCCKYGCALGCGIAGYDLCSQPPQIARALKACAAGYALGHACGWATVIALREHCKED